MEGSSQAGVPSPYKSEQPQDAKTRRVKMDMIIAQFTAGYSAMLDRALHPILPVPNATSSYWMDDALYPEVNLNSKNLPDIADYVVIGTGITGLAAAKTVLEISHNQHTEMPLRVVALDARDVCGGATGRNGGHIKVNPYADFAMLKSRLGSVSKAKEILQFMRRHLGLLKEVGKDIPLGEVRDVETVDLYLEEDDFEQATAQVKDLKANVPDIKINVWQGADARRKFGCNELIAGAISYSAGAAFPFRLVTGGWKALLDTYPELVLRANTPVQEISIAPNSPQHPYAIKTPQGTFRTRHVLHATNGYAPYLLPRLSSSLTGGRGCMTAQDVGAKFPATHGNRSWRPVYSPGFDYVTQRPDGKGGAPGDLMVGGGFRQSKLDGIDLLGEWDDSKRDALPLIHVRGVMPTIFQPSWGGGSGATAGSVKKDWTGIMGFTGDALPFVGFLSQNITQRRFTGQGAGVGGRDGSGEWIAAGFNGHGMVWSWLSGAAAAILMAGQDKDDLTKVPGRPGGTLDSWFPRDVVALDEARLTKANLKNLGEKI